MFNKIFLCAIFTALFISSAVAQNQTDEYNKNEFYVGYSNQQNNKPGRQVIQGIEGSYTRNVSRFFGIRATVSFAKASRPVEGTLTDPVTGSYRFQQIYRRSISNFLAGVQIKDNRSNGRFKPFAFALGGVAVKRSTYDSLICASASCPSNIPVLNISGQTTGLAGSFGGGLDIKINKRVDLRAIQVDYNPIFADGSVENNVRIGIGFVFH